MNQCFGILACYLFRGEHINIKYGLERRDIVEKGGGDYTISLVSSPYVLYIMLKHYQLCYFNIEYFFNYFILNSEYSRIRSNGYIDIAWARHSTTQLREVCSKRILLQCRSCCKGSRDTHSNDDDVLHTLLQPYSFYPKPLSALLPTPHPLSLKPLHHVL